MGVVTTRISRREVLRIGAGLAWTTAGLQLLAACTPAPQTPAVGTGAGQTQTSGKLALPTYIPISNVPKPDLPGTPDGLVMPGYQKYPSPLVKSVPQPPGKGGDVNAITVSLSPAPTLLEQNPAWQQVNKELGVSIKIPSISTVDYPSRLSTVVAGSDLPDLIAAYILTTTLANLADFLNSTCADLTPYLSGDAVKDYPNLANIPTPCWAETVYNGSVYGVPVPRAPFLNAFLVRQDLVDQAQLQPPTSADEFKKLLLTLTQAQQNKFGLACAGASASFFGLSSQSPLLMVFGTPNNWALDKSGKLVKDYETDQYKAAVSFARDLWSAGAYHPDSRTLSGTTLSTALRGGQAVVASHSFGALIAQWSLLAAENPAARLRVIHPFSADGKTKPIYHTGPSNFGISFVKKASPDRVKLLLRVLNYLAAPFGSQEWALLNYGVEGVHFNRDANGVPALNDKGRNEVLSTWKYITNNPEVLFSPDRSQQYATDIQADEKAMGDVAMPDPTLGVYSATYSGQQALLDQAMGDGVSDIVVGRSQVSDLDGLVKAWRDNGGEKARGEYQDAIAAAK
jgi:putative aldouronate transport system substrate-binding protein